MGNLRAIDRTLARQHGIVSREQALNAGMSRTQIQHRLATGEWVSLSRGVYASASAPPTWERQLQAALLAHEESVAAGRSAAWLHEIEGFKRSRPEVLAPFTANARSDLARVVRSRHFELVETCHLRGFEATTFAETVLTLSLREPPSIVERVLDHGLALRKVSAADFDPILERLEFARQRGLPALRKLVKERSVDAFQPPTTDLERLLYRLLDSPEVPRYVRQLPIRYERLDATVDAYVPSWRMIVEGDGRAWHTRKADFERDRKRDNLAAEEGLIVVRFTYSMLRDDPSGCLATLLNAGRWRSTA